MIRIEEELVVNNKTIDARILSRMFLAGAKNLEAKKEWINELNVFPVPDGDTGTNMTMTIMAAAAEVGSLGEPDMESLAKAISSGSLRGARGNSGVILSQLLRGFTRSVKNSKELDAIDIAAAMEKGVETAYKAVMKPKEGTILTVAREAAAKAVELAETAEDLDTFFQAIQKLRFGFGSVTKQFRMHIQIAAMSLIVFVQIKLVKQNRLILIQNIPGYAGVIRD